MDKLINYFTLHNYVFYVNETSHMPQENMVTVVFCCEVATPITISLWASRFVLRIKDMR